MDRRDRIRLQSDVLIVGGGAAGVATAVTAARQGLKVTLVERYGFCGGGAVAGLSGTVCGLYAATDDRSAPPEQVVFGFADEFCRRLDALGGLSAPMPYGKTFTRVHDPLIWRETADSFLREAGVEVIFHAVATGVRGEGDRIEGLEIWTKEGPVDAQAGIVVDASGDADVVALAGLPSFIGDNGSVQNPTMIFRLMGVDVARFKAEYGEDTIMPERISELIRRKDNLGEYDLPRAKIWLFPTTRPGELLCNCTRVLGPDGRELNTLRWRDFTDAEFEGRRQMREYARFFRDNLAGCENSFVNDTGVQVGVRQTRQLSGVARLMNADVVAGTKSREGIARSPWPIELHTGEKPRVEWLLDDYYEVPFGCFVPERGEGLLAAGRCLSAEHEAVASARVTAQCFAYGHAVGHAAALAVREKISARAISGVDLRAILDGDGARLG
ncbi:FAD-dependent oxidoreductase [Methylobacterium dankookense]|uniref:Thiamine thiazole synthase n=1 Tax=Methylobacterium dankookense TaxID=560405 RepID=A0A564FVM9_9HYPH|nr:FAD-dependent oxidoreductase [Methylobacterium dankookense]GJD55084.1 Thiamine thiazole synthase [Methylobacterium dankookense]VUF12082.1 Putative thiazole biosynthetic enzyme [Methylobacterium dankookense]